MATPFSTPKSQSKTKDGLGGSTTTGLQGSITNTNGTLKLSANETLTAFREGHSLGLARTVSQVRTTVGNTTTVDQPDYGWGTRKIPSAVLVAGATNLSGPADLTDVEATYFGKGDDEDEGTGTPAFGTVQTDSSIFGASLKGSFLVAHGLATLTNKVLHATPKGLNAQVEIFYDKTNCLARVPIVDMGPGEKQPASIDLTVALTAFLQNLTENDYRKLDNITVSFRVIINAAQVMAQTLSLKLPAAKGKKTAVKKRAKRKGTGKA